MMKKKCFLGWVFFGPLIVFSQELDKDNYIDYDTKETILYELTWSLSQRNYYIPIYVRCNDSSKVFLCLASSGDLFLNYQCRNSISADDFRKILVEKIADNDTLNGICNSDFEHLYKPSKYFYSYLPRGITFITLATPRRMKYASSNKDTLVATFFDSQKKYTGELEMLPVIAYGLMKYGLLLEYGNGEIYYEDVIGRKESKLMRNGMNVLE